MSYFFTYSMEKSPSWEANRFSMSQQIPHILWNLKVHHSTHNCSPPVTTPSQINPVHAQHPTSWTVILILYTHLCPGSSTWSLSVRFSHQNPVCTSPHKNCLLNQHFYDIMVLNVHAPSMHIQNNDVTPATSQNYIRHHITNKLFSFNCWYYTVCTKNHVPSWWFSFPFPQNKLQSPALTMPPLSHLT